MSVLKYSVLAICLIGVAHGATTAASCGTAPASGMMFQNSSTTCAKAIACQTTYCTCMGTPAPSSPSVFPACGALSGTAPSCTSAATCIAAKMACLNAAADDVSAGCQGLSGLKMSNLGVVGGALYNASAGYAACKYESCKMLQNSSSTGSNCTFDVTTLCASPVNFIATLSLRGRWAAILGDATKKARLTSSLAADLGKVFRSTVAIRKLHTKATRRRQTGETNLLVEFQVSGVSGNNADVKAALASVNSGNGAFLTQTLAEYQAENGAGASFTFVGVSSGSSSSATFGGSSTSGSGSGSTSTGGTTTVTTTSGGTSTSGTPTPQTDSPGSDGTSGANAQTITAAVIIALVGAVLL